MVVKINSLNHEINNWNNTNRLDCKTNDNRYKKNERQISKDHFSQKITIAKRSETLKGQIQGKVIVRIYLL